MTAPEYDVVTCVCYVAESFALEGAVAVVPALVRGENYRGVPEPWHWLVVVAVALLPGVDAGKKRKAAATAGGAAAAVAAKKVCEGLGRFVGTKETRTVGGGVALPRLSVTSGLAPKGDRPPNVDPTTAGFNNNTLNGLAGSNSSGVCMMKTKDGVIWIYFVKGKDGYTIMTPQGVKKGHVRKDVLFGKSTKGYVDHHVDNGFTRMVVRNKAGIDPKKKLSLDDWECVPADQQPEQAGDLDGALDLFCGVSKGRFKRCDVHSLKEGESK